MLTIVIIILLVLAFYQGYRRGFIMELVRLITYGLSASIANRWTDELAAYLSMLVPFPSVQVDSELAIYSEQVSFHLDTAYYRALAFIVLAFVGWLVSNLIAMFFTKTSYFNVLKYPNRIIGGLINVVIVYVIIFLVLFILSLLPIEFIQQAFVDNPLAYRIVSQTPYLSDAVGQAWFNLNPF